MKILIVNRFFGGAQIPTGRMAEDVARLLVEEGHEVTALASTGTYTGAEKQAQHGAWSMEQGVTEQRSEDRCQPKRGGDRLHGNQRSESRGKEHGALCVETVRVPKWMPRALAWLWFTWQARKRIPQMDWDVCVLMTDPPLLPLLAVRVKAAEGPRDHRTTGPRDATRRVAVWLMDLYPEALTASGRIGTGNPIYRWYFNMRQRALAAADLLICLGHAQKELLGDGRVERGPWSVEREADDRRGEEGGDGVSAGQCLPSAAPHAVSQTRLSEAVEIEKPNYRTTEPPRPPLTQGVRTAVVPPWDDRGNIALATDASLKNLALYAGNLGEAHCFEEILAAAPYLPGDWTIRFAVRGAKFAALRAKASRREFSHGLRGLNTDGVRAAAPTGLRGSAHAVGLPKGYLRFTALAVSPPNEEVISRGCAVEITGYASEEETPGLLASARVHLITMSPGWEGIVVPSKLYGCIRTGRPVLFVGPEDADTAREIRAHDWGKVLPPGASGEEVAAAILELAARPTRAPQSQHGAGEIAALLVATAGLQD